MDGSPESRRKLYWALIGVMGFVEIIALIAFWGMGRLQKMHRYQVGYEQYLGSEQFFFLNNIFDFLITTILLLGAAMAFCMNRISLIAMETEPERAKAHKNDAIAYLVVIAFILMFFIILNIVPIVHLLGM